MPKKYFFGSKERICISLTNNNEKARYCSVSGDVKTYSFKFNPEFWKPSGFLREKNTIDVSRDLQELLPQLLLFRMAVSGSKNPAVHWVFRKSNQWEEERLLLFWVFTILCSGRSSIFHF